MEPEIALARILYEAMERLDPSGPEDASPWDRLPDRDREFYRHCIRALIANKGLVLAALGQQ